MSKKYETKEVVKRLNVFVEKRCDICGTKSDSEYGWKEDIYNCDETDITRMHGPYFPEGDFRKRISLDMYPSCWCEKFVPWVESQGGKFTVVENDGGKISDARPDER